MTERADDPAGQAIGLAAHHLAQGRPARALEVIGRADPSAAGYWEVRASALHDLERYEEAAAAARDGLRQSDSQLLFAVLASALVELGELGGAERVVLSALERQPDAPSLLALYARMAATGGQVEKAAALIAEAQRHAPLDASVLCTRALVLWAQLRDRDAERQLRDVLSRDPENEAALCLLSAIESERGVHASAYSRLRRVLGRNPALIRELRDTLPESEAVAHPLLAPVRPFMVRERTALLWLAVVAALLLALALRAVWLVVLVAALYVVYAVYGHAAFWILRWRARRRRL